MIDVLGCSTARHLVTRSCLCCLHVASVAFFCGAHAALSTNKKAFYWCISPDARVLSDVFTIVAIGHEVQVRLKREHQWSVSEHACRVLDVPVSGL